MVFYLIFKLPDGFSFLTHLSLATFYGTSANCAEPDQTPQNVASDPVLDCLPTEGTFKIKIKSNFLLPVNPQIRNEFVLMIKVGNSSRFKWVKKQVI